MGLWKRIVNIYRLSEYEVPSVGEKGNVGDIIAPLIKRKTYAEFIMPDRTKEIFERKANATLDDVIQ